jgi:hypothetical protein
MESLSPTRLVAGGLVSAVR